MAARAGTRRNLEAKQPVCKVGNVRPGAARRQIRASQVTPHTFPETRIRWRNHQVRILIIGHHRKNRANAEFCDGRQKILPTFPTTSWGTNHRIGADIALVVDASQHLETLAHSGEFIPRTPNSAAPRLSANLNNGLHRPENIRFSEPLSCSTSKLHRSPRILAQSPVQDDRSWIQLLCLNPRPSAVAVLLEMDLKREQQGWSAGWIERF